MSGLPRSVLAHEKAVRSSVLLFFGPLKIASASSSQLDALRQTVWWRQFDW